VENREIHLYVCDQDQKHTSGEQGDPRGLDVVTGHPSLPELNKELDLQSQLGLAWKDIHDLVEYKKRTSQLISSVLQLAQLHINHQLIFNSSVVVELLCLVNGKIIDCNNVFCSYFNYTRDQALQTLNFYTLTHPDSLPNMYIIVESLLSGGVQIQQATHKFMTCDGKTVSCRITLWLSGNESGPQTYLRAILEPAAVATAPLRPTVTPRTSPYLTLNPIASSTITPCILPLPISLPSSRPLMSNSPISGSRTMSLSQPMMSNNSPISGSRTIISSHPMVSNSPISGARTLTSSHPMVNKSPSLQLREYSTPSSSPWPTASSSSSSTPSHRSSPSFSVRYLPQSLEASSQRGGEGGEGRSGDMDRVMKEDMNFEKLLNLQRQQRMSTAMSRTQQAGQI